MVEHRPVKAIVAGSSPASGANETVGFYTRLFHWYSSSSIELEVRRSYPTRRCLHRALVSGEVFLAMPKMCAVRPPEPWFDNLTILGDLVGTKSQTLPSENPNAGF